MKPYSLDLREKVINEIEKGDSSVRKVAQRFGVSKNFVQRLVTQKRTKGHILPRKQGGSMVSPVMGYKAELIEIFEQQNDATRMHSHSVPFGQRTCPHVRSCAYAPRRILRTTF